MKRPSTRCLLGLHRGSWDGRFEGTVVHVVRWHSEEKAVDAYLCRLNRCLDVRSTNKPFTGCHNLIDSEHYPFSYTQAPSWQLCVRSKGSIKKPHGKKKRYSLSHFSHLSLVLCCRVEEPRIKLNHQFKKQFSKWFLSSHELCSVPNLFFS